MPPLFKSHQRVYLPRFGEVDSELVLSSTTKALGGTEYTTYALTNYSYSLSELEIFGSAFECAKAMLELELDKHRQHVTQIMGSLSNLPNKIERNRLLAETNKTPYPEEIHYDPQASQ